MTFTRRRLLGLFAAFTVLAACDSGNSLTRKLKGLAMKAITPEEIELLKNPLLRPAWFASKGLPQGILEIRDRVFGGERSLLRGADIKDVRFVNCSFEMFQGYDNNLENVTFEECQFLGGVFTGYVWKNVKLLRCYAEGPFKIGGATGNVEFEECTMRGLTSDEGGGYGGWSAHFGVATGQDGSTSFLKCKIKNVTTGGAIKLQFVDCDIEDLRGECEGKRTILLIEKCRAKGKMDLKGMSGYTSVTIKDSQLGLVNLMGASSDLVEIEKSSMSMEMASPNYGVMQIIKSNFHTEGFACYQSVIGSLTIEECSFDPRSKGLQLYGEPKSELKVGEDPIYWGRRRTLILRNMTVPKAKLNHMQVGTLTLDNATLKDADLSLCCIDTVQFKNARLEGELNLTKTTIRRIENNGLTNQAKIYGKLEANPDAPKPILEPAKPAELKKPEDKKPDNQSD